MQISVLDLVCLVFFSMHNLPLNSYATVAIEGIKARFNACQKFGYKLIEDCTLQCDLKAAKNENEQIKFKKILELVANFSSRSCLFFFPMHNHPPYSGATVAN